MTTATNRNGVRKDELHIYRPLLETDGFEAVHDVISGALPKGLKFAPRLARYAGVTLIESQDIALATDKSRRRHTLNPQTLGRRLRAAVPATGNEAIVAHPAPIDAIQRYGAGGRSLVVVLEHPELEVEQRCALGHLGHLARLEISQQRRPHLCYGEFNDSIPDRVVQAVAQTVTRDSAYILGAVLPPSEPLAY